MQQVLFVIVMALSGCGNAMWEDFFESGKLESSKGEKI